MAVSGAVGAVARVSVDCCIHDGFSALLDLKASVDPDYLLFCLHHLKTEHEKAKAGAIWTNITTADIRRLKVPIPPIEIQHRLRAALKCVQTLSASTRHADKAAGALSTSIVEQLFRGPQRGETLVKC